MKKISPKQQRILDYISEFSLEHGYPPSVREEYCAEMDLRSPSTVHAHLKKLQEAGYLEPSDHKSRALTPVSGPSMVPRVPILGRVTAGLPHPCGGGAYRIRPVRAGGRRRSMPCASAAVRDPARILDGDLVIVQQRAGSQRQYRHRPAGGRGHLQNAEPHAGRRMADAGKSGLPAYQRYGLPDPRRGQSGLSGISPAYCRHWTTASNSSRASARKRRSCLKNCTSAPCATRLRPIRATMRTAPASPASRISARRTNTPSARSWVPNPSSAASARG